MAISHEITAIVAGKQVKGFISGNVESSLITPADGFVLRIPFTKEAWDDLVPDSRIRIKADGITILDGFIGRRQLQSKAGVIEIGGRDRVGRLLDESAPAINYTGMTIREAVERLMSPWFQKLTIDHGRNRRLRRGKGRRVAAGTEPVVTINIRVPRKGRVHPGQTRGQVIQEIVSRAGLMFFSSADGTELIISTPNVRQQPQYTLAFGTPSAEVKTTVRDMHILNDWEDRYSLILCAGVGGQGDLNYGRNVNDKRGRVFDNPFNTLDGTGRDFQHPKRLFLPERAFASYNDAQRVAELEQWRRDFKRQVIMIECSGLGQLSDNGEYTLFCPDTIARVVHTPLEIDENYLMVSCSYSFNRDNGDTTYIQVVPDSTRIVI